MKSAEDLYQTLKRQYGGALPFKSICEDEGIVVVKAALDEGVNGLYVRANGARLIVLNSNLTRWERRDAAMHELYHHFRSPSRMLCEQHSAREEKNADLFAALCRIPGVSHDDSIQSIIEKHNVSHRLARLRIDYELKRMQS